MLNQPSTNDTSLVIVGDYLLDPQVGMLSGPSGTHHLCDRMTAILCALVDRNSELVEREWLVSEFWSGEPAASRSLTQCVGRLRHYFEDTAKNANYIETVPGRGYRLVAPVYGTTQQVEPIQLQPLHHQAPGRSRIGSLIREFRNRKVCRALLVYTIVIWLVFQVSEIVVPALAIPLWVNSLVVILGILGFPIAASLAWIFDWTPNGLVRQGGNGSGSHGVSPRRATDLVFDTLLVAAAILLGATLIYNSLDYGVVTSANAGSNGQIESSEAPAIDGRSPSNISW